MRPLNTLSEARELDHHLIEKYSLDETSLINSAAREAYDAVRDHLLSKRVLFLIGPGNNGSDGLEMARLLSRENQKVSIFYLTERGNEENLKRREALSYLNRAFEIRGYDVIVDALFGFSFHGAVEDDLYEVINEVNNSGSFVISIDVPSASLVRADITVSLMCHKLNLYHPMTRSRSGKIILRNPGFPESELEKSASSTYLIEDGDICLNKLSIDDYKNTRGHVAVLGGSEKYPGAPILASLAAIHSAAGLITLVSEDSVLDKAFKHYPSLILANNLDAIDRYSSIAIGPGWDSGNEELLDQAIESGKNIVIDADGIKLLKNKHLSWHGVITPHLGEYRNLCKLLSIPNGLEDAESLRKALQTLSKKLECVVVLKSSTLWIANSDLLYVYDGSNPSLGVAGSGDVLTGIIAALLGQGLEPEKAAIGGVILHQRAGRRAKEKYGFYCAEELIGEIAR